MRNRRTEALSLLEVVIAVAILAVVAGAVYASLLSTATSCLDGMHASSIQEQGRCAVEELARELRMADRDAVSMAVHAVRFSLPTGYAAGSVVWGSEIEYAFEPLDANNDGIVDDGQVVRSQDGRRRVLCDHVADGGFTLSQAGDCVRIRLELVAAGERNRLLRTSVETSVTLRNRSR